MMKYVITVHKSIAARPMRPIQYARRKTPISGGGVVARPPTTSFPTLLTDRGGGQKNRMPPAGDGSAWNSCPRQEIRFVELTVNPTEAFAPGFYTVLPTRPAPVVVL